MSLLRERDSVLTVKRLRTQYWVSGKRLRTQYWVSGKRLRTQYWVSGKRLRTQYWVSGKRLRRERDSGLSTESLSLNIPYIYLLSLTLNILDISRFFRQYSQNAPHRIACWCDNGSLFLDVLHMSLLLPYACLRQYSQYSQNAPHRIWAGYS